VRDAPGARAARRLTWPLRSLPDFVIAGAQKAGTTSLWHYLAAHPRIVPAARKELHFFDRAGRRHLAAYRAQFPLRRAGRLTFEASPTYLLHPFAPERLAAAVPDVRVVVVLRDPAARAWSHYRDNRARGTEDLGFLGALQAEDERLRADRDLVARGLDPGRAFRNYSYVERGRYAEQLERWFACIARDRILIVESRQLFDDPAAAFGAVLGFLGLDLPARPPEFVAHNAAPGPGPDTPGAPDAVPDAAAARYLADVFAEPNRRLRALTGISF
jgi:hypothetical protein